MTNAPFIERIYEVDSTNSELKRRVSASNVEMCSAVIAERQTAGRGRKGRTWMNTADALMMSISIPVLTLNPDEIPMISHAASLAVFNSISQLDGFCESTDTGIKWPNDILLNGKKVCGVLSEISTNSCGIPHAIIGIGINVNAESFPDGMMQPVISVRQFIGRSVDKYALGKYAVNEVLKKASMVANNEGIALIEEYKHKCITIGKAITIYPNFSDPYEAVAESIDNFGRLIVIKYDGRMKALDSADVSVGRPIKL